MSHFIDGFSSELEKLAVVGAAKSLGKLIMKHPMKALTVGLVGAAGVAGARSASSAKKRRIAASSRGPSKAWYVNYHKALGLPKKLTKLQRQRLSRNFARYREKQ
jgi:hypothetical protein